MKIKLPMADIRKNLETVFKTSLQSLKDHPLFTEIGFLALTVLLGLQVLRVLVPGVVWLLGDRMSLGAIESGGIALVVFLSAFLSKPLRRLLGDRLTIVVAAGGLGLLRLLMQILSGVALANLILALVGTALFILFFPPFLHNVQIRSRLGMGHLALGFILGLILDTAIHGGFGTYDVSWQTGPAPLLVTLFLVLIQWTLLGGATYGMKGRSADTSSSATLQFSKGRTYTWLAIGPFIFLELVVFQNIARISVLTGWSLPWAFGWTLLANTLGLAAATWALIWRRRFLWPLSLVFGLILVASMLIPYQEGVIAAIQFITGQILVCLLMVTVFISLGAYPHKSDSTGAVDWANAIGMLLLLLLLLGYYAVYDISLPYSNTIFEPIAAFLVAACAVSGSIGLRHVAVSTHRAWVATAVGILLLTIPLVQSISWNQPTTVTGTGFPVRIMTYNLHNGFNTEGHLDLEALARVIENANPDIIALQEVSRGWVVSGRVDMLLWLSHRLDMPYVFGPTADPFWGNAILSRYPILEYSQHDLPPRNLFILRGFTAAQIDLGDGARLQVIATHYHHLEEDSVIRQLQSTAIVEFWDEANYTVILGDLNAQPQDAEISLLRNPGLHDAAAEVFGAPPQTFPSYAPDRRIDYIWISPDLTATDVNVPLSTASDHLAIIAEINR